LRFSGSEEKLSFGVIDVGTNFASLDSCASVLPTD